MLICGLTLAAQAQISKFEHIIVVVQENRTPDNLFYRLCLKVPCSTTPTTHQYNIQTSNWLDASSPTGMWQPTAVPFANGYDINHNHANWKLECDLNILVNPPVCRMDGAAKVYKNHGAYVFVENTVDSKHPNGILYPYLTLATQFGWANYMFQTNEGPSYPAHQFIFGGTSALSASDDLNGIFVSENVSGSAAGCYAPDKTLDYLINSLGKETLYAVDYATGKTLCVTGHQTMADLLDSAGLGWKYYTLSVGTTSDVGASIWTAPNAIESICVPDATHTTCTGTEWAHHVDLKPSDVLKDMGVGGAPCNLQAVSWVIPNGANSDHAPTATGGPAWVASIVNALGNSTCKNPDGTSYWDTTAVVITWDDWGGWYDHEPPTLLAAPQGGYQLGFRVPLIFVSAYTPVGFISNTHHDFGSILRFIEHNFNLGEGKLGFADARATTNLSEFYTLTSLPRKFAAVPAAKTALAFVREKVKMIAPDND
jgi:phospholipase C